MFEIFKLAGRVIVDSSDADKALEGTDKKAEQTTNAIGEYASKFKKWAAGLVTVSTIVAGLKKSWEISSEVADLGDSIDKSSQKFLLSRQAYQEWAYVAARSGFTIEQIGDAVVDLSKKVGEGGDNVFAALEEIGISAADAMTSTPEELFDKVISGLQGMENSTRKAYIADQLLGGAAKDLGPLLNSNAEDTQALKDQVHQLGGVMSDTLIDKSAAYKDSVTDLETAWQGVKNDLAEHTVPAMTQITTGLTEMLTGDFVDGLKTAADGVGSYFDAIVAGIGERLVSPVERFTVWLDEKFSFLPGFGGAADAFDELQRGKEQGRPWWEVAGYIADPVVAAGNDWDSRAAEISTTDVAGLAFNAYTYRAHGGDKYDFLAAVEEKFDNATMEAVADALERLDTKISDYVDSGGNVEDFWGQMRELYGNSIDGVVAAMDGSAAQWDQATLDYATANINAVNSINAAAEKFLETYGAPYVDGEHSGRAGKFAVGLPFVPRDDFPARLHYGERVLTRQENEDYSKGQGAGGSTTINIQTVTQSPAQTAAAITAALARARWAM